MPQSTVTLGITGGIGSGKSTVCRILEQYGARIFRADEVAKRLMIEDPEVRREITAAFGENSYRSDGSLNRSYLAREVFGNAERVKQINGIVHPRVFEAFKSEVAQAESDDTPVLVHEAALLFESGIFRKLDATVYVDAPQRVRIARVVQRDGVAEQAVRDRIKHQLAAYKGRSMADYVVRNDASREVLERRVRNLMKRLRTRFGNRVFASA